MWVQNNPFMSAYVKEFNEYLLWCEERGVTPQQNRVDSKQRFLDWANEKGLINKMTWDANGTTFQKVDRRKEFNGKMLLSIDMRKANFSILKMVAIQREGDIHDSWEGLCEHLNIHPVLAGSKMFRQQCFGEYEPAKTADMQRYIIGDLVDKLGLKDQLVYCSHDEIVIPYVDNLAKVKADLNEVFGYGGPIEFRLTPYRMDPVYDVVIKFGDEDLLQKLDEIREEKWAMARSQNYVVAAELRDRERRYMDLFYAECSRQIKEQSVPKNAHPSYCLRREYEVKRGELVERKKFLFGIPGNRFYVYLRSALLKEPWQDKDLIFLQDGMKAKWISDKLE